MTGPAPLLALLLLLPLPAAASGPAAQPGHDQQMAALLPADRRPVAVLLYDGALVLDYGIAAEMFLAADHMRAFRVFTVARDPQVTVSVLGTVTPQHRFTNAPAADVVIVPGGPTWAEAATDPDLVSYLKRTLEQGGTLLSVCSGGLLLAKAGLLQDKPATTLQAALPMLERLSPSTRVVAGQPFVDAGQVVTAAGSGTAVEATLHLIARLAQPRIADDLARRYLDYRKGLVTPR